MALIKATKDHFIKFLFGGKVAPRGLVDLLQYFRTYGPINFKFEETPEAIIAVSTNFKYGSIITSGADQKELDKNIKDAILTAFEVPSSYAKEAQVIAVGRSEHKYALA